LELPESAVKDWGFPGLGLCKELELVMFILSELVFKHVLYPQSFSPEQIHFFGNTEMYIFLLLRYFFSEQIVEFAPLILDLGRDVSIHFGGVAVFVSVVATVRVA